VASAKTIPLPQVQAAIARLAAAIAERHRGSDRLWLLGIANGGTPLAHRLADAINARMPRLPRRRPSGILKLEPKPKSGRERPARSTPPSWATAGALDISFHRDDIGHHPVPKEFANTFLPGDVTGATVILVDDVLFTGRTIKASLDELFDHGRPAQVELAVLVDRGGRRLPITADYVGLTLAPAEYETVVVTLDNDHPERDRIRVVSAAI
jgi:pyrimidine operon attenuation protein/uracil phosphoribosyltransferase